MTDRTTENGLQTDIDDFIEYLRGLDPNNVTAGTLSHIYIPDAVRPLKTRGAEVGVSGDLINEGSAGLPVVVQAYPNMQVRDVIKVYWGDDLVGTDTVSEPGSPLTLNIPPENIPEGINELYYGLTRTGTDSEEQSARLNVLVRFNYPGEDAANSDELAAPQVSHTTIELDSRNVKVTIAPYAKMRRYDRIHLSWSGHELEHEVKPNEVGRAVVIDIPQDAVEGASDANVQISYYVVDEVGNESADWSADTVIPNGQVTGLPAPFVINPQTGRDVLRLRPGEPGSSGLSVEIDPPAEGFEPGAQVNMTWTAETAQGVITVVDLGTQWVVRRNRTLVFDLPAEHLQPLWGGRGTASYEVIQDGQVEGSRRTRVNFVGAPLRLPPPQLNGISQGYVDADLDPVIVVIPAAAQLQPNDIVTLTWRGRRPDTTLLLIQPTALPIRQAGEDAEFRLDRARALLPLDGGTLDISYTVTRGNARLPSESALLDVGETPETLAPPSLDPTPENGVLDPSLPEYAAGVDLVVTLPGTVAVPYDVEIEWSTSSGGVHHDTQRVSDANATSIRFQIPRAQLVGGLIQAEDVTAYYRIVRPNQPDQISYDLELVLGAQPQLDLALPTVNELQQSTLDPSTLTHGATVTIPASAGLAAGDKVVVYWDGDHANSVTEVHDSVARGEEGRPRTLPIDLSYVLASENGEVDVQYEILRFDRRRPSDWSGVVTFRVQRGPLPLPVINEAVQDTINPFDLHGQATVVIAAAARLAIGDRVVVQLVGLVSNHVEHFTHPVQSGEEDRALHVMVPTAVITANVNQGLKLSYRIIRSLDGREEESAEQLYSVNQEISAVPLRVMGARYNVDGRADITPPRRLTAVNASTSVPVLAEWRYSGDADWTPGQTWRDTQPERLLEVRTRANSVVLNVANVIGNREGVTALVDTSTPGAYSARSWGSIGVAPVLDDVVDLSVTILARAARRLNGAITCWGHAGYGGTMRPEDIARRDFLKVRSNYDAFVALYGSDTGERRLTGWGAPTHGGRIPQHILDLRDVTDVAASFHAFAALRSNGRVACWGHAGYGAVLPQAYEAFDDVVEVQGSRSGFIARRVTANGRKKVFSWGDVSSTGNMPAAIQQREDIESIEAHGDYAYCLLTSQGQVLAFGNAGRGGTVPVEIARLTDIVEVTGTSSAFCARRKNGHIVAWGLASSGGTLPADIARRADVIQVAASGKAFAALFADGSVKSWGDAATGGNSSAVTGQLISVRAIYSTYYAFIALTDDGRVVTWGDSRYGGNSLPLQAQLVHKLRAQRR